MASPCVGCGYCCQKVKCPLGVRLYGGSPGPCPGLMWSQDRYWCWPVMRAEGEEQATLKEQLAIGAGCSNSLFNTQRVDAIKRQLIAEATGERR